MAEGVDEMEFVVTRRIFEANRVGNAVVALSVRERRRV